MKVLNVKRVVNGLKKREKFLASGFSDGLKIGGLLIQAASQKQTPIEFGPLRNSHRTESTGRGFDTRVEVSCQAAYAIYVHEDMTARHAPGTNAKFLERAAREKSKEVVTLVKRMARRG